MYPGCLWARMDAALLLRGLDRLPQDVPAKRHEWKPISQCSELRRCSLKTTKNPVWGGKGRHGAGRAFRVDSLREGGRISSFLGGESGGSEKGRASPGSVDGRRNWEVPVGKTGFGGLWPGPCSRKRRTQSDTAQEPAARLARCRPS